MDEWLGNGGYLHSAIGSFSARDEGTLSVSFIASSGSFPFFFAPLVQLLYTDGQFLHLGEF